MLAIIRRELVGLLRTRRAMFLLVVVAASFALLVMLRWPSEGVVDTSGARSLQVFNIFGYGLLATVILLTPVFPATSIVACASDILRPGAFTPCPSLASGTG